MFNTITLIPTMRRRLAVNEKSTSAHSIEQSIATLGLVMIFVGPAIQFMGVYASHLVALAYLVYRAMGLFVGRTFLSDTTAVTMVLFASILIYASTFALVGTGFEESVWRHIVMLILSFSTFAAAYGISLRVLTIRENERAVSFFCYFLLAWCSAEYFFGLRLGVSRYASALDDIASASHLGNIPIVPTGFYGNENNLAFICFVFSLISIAIFRRFKGLVLALLLLLVVVVTESRMMLAALFVCGLEFVVWRRSFTKSAVILLTLVSIAVILSYWSSALVSLLPDQDTKLTLAIRTLLEPIDFGLLASRKDSIGVRIDLAQQALNIFLQSPLLGSGPGTLIDRIAVEVSSSETIVNVHNPALEVLVEYGVFGTCLWIAGFALILWKVTKISNWYTRRLLFVLVSVYPIAGIALSSAYYFSAAWGTLGFALALAERNAKESTL